MARLKWFATLIMTGVMTIGCAHTVVSPRARAKLGRRVVNARHEPVRVVLQRGHMSSRYDRVVASFSHDGAQLITTGDGDRTTKIWDTATGLLVYSRVGTLDAISTDGTLGFAWTTSGAID